MIEYIVEYHTDDGRTDSWLFTNYQEAMDYIQNTLTTTDKYKLSELKVIENGYGGRSE